jgi:thiol-disulfide isomerase/thioredoxin
VNVKKKNKIIICITVIVLLAIVLLVGCHTDSSGENAETDDNAKHSEEIEKDINIEEKVEIGYMAPNFNIELLSGETAKLSDYRGKVVLINFWATWCPPCIGEMPDIQKLSEVFAEDLIVLAVNCNEKKNVVNDFIKEKGYTFNVGLDEKGQIQEKYPTMGIPYTIIMDKDRIIINTHIGASGDMFSVYEKDVNIALDSEI